MAIKKPSQLGINTIWDGPYKSPTSSLVPGNSRDGGIQVSKYPSPSYSGPISSKAQAKLGGSASQHGAKVYSPSIDK
mgnify:CR=1 FL=1